MTDDRIRAALAEAIAAVAPEMDLGDVDLGEPLRDELDIDSMDFLRVVVGLRERLGVEIPEADYPRVDTLGSLLSYLQRASGDP